jgi:hypothetical protein
MNTIERTDKIDAYLAGTMSDAEKKEFEGLLLGSETSLEDRTKLQDEMELQKEIIFAIRRRGFREMVKKDIAEIKQEEEEHHQRIKRITIWSLGSSTLMAMAAVLLLLFVLAPVAQQMQGLSSQYIAGVVIDDIERDVDNGEDMLSVAIVLMQNNQWEEAEQIINKIYTQPTIKTSDLQKVEWLRAICLMHRGKVIKAKKLLNKIANSNSPYQIEARKMLDDLD